MMTLKKERVASVKDATRLRSKSNYNKIGFNPRTRKGCDLYDDDMKEFLKVSIHAPVKDATGFCFHLHGGDPVSIHAPVKDATATPTHRQTC